MHLTDLRNATDSRIANFWTWTAKACKCKIKAIVKQRKTIDLITSLVRSKLTGQSIDFLVNSFMLISEQCSECKQHSSGLIIHFDNE